MAMWVTKNEITLDAAARQKLDLLLQIIQEEVTDDATRARIAKRYAAVLQDAED